MAVTPNRGPRVMCRHFIAKRGRASAAPGRARPRAARAAGLQARVRRRGRARRGHGLRSHGVKVLVDPKSLPTSTAPRLDFVREGLERRFQVPQPERERTAAAAANLPRLRPDPPAMKAAGHCRPFLPCHARRRLHAETWCELCPIGHARRREGLRPLHQRSAAKVAAPAMAQWAVRVNEAYRRLKDPLQRRAYQASCAAGVDPV